MTANVRTRAALVPLSETRFGRRGQDSGDAFYGIELSCGDIDDELIGLVV